MLLGVIAVLLFGSCEKKEECETLNTGKVLISNSSNNRYEISINGVYKGLAAANNITEFTMQGGNAQQLRAEQHEGFIVTPTVKTTSFNVISCSDYSWQIP